MTRFSTYGPGLRGALFCCAGLAVGAGCVPPEKSVQQAEARPSAAAMHRSFVLGESVEGRPIRCEVIGHGADVCLILASIHGSEPAGTPLVHRLSLHLRQRLELLVGRRVVLIPVANPDGYYRRERHNVRDVDLNRNFPAGNYRRHSTGGTSALSEPEAVAIHAAIERFKPSRIISIHQPMNHGDPCIDYDGPARPLAEALAARCDLNVDRIGSRPGSLGSYAGVTKGIPIITVELPKEASAWDGEQLWDRYGEMMLAAVRFSDESRFAEAEE